MRLRLAVSLTVKYDIRADEPEETRVFRLLKGSNDLIDALLQQHAPQLSLLDRSRLVAWSLGNARLALALARRVGSGESLSHLTDQQLFERLFHQRHGQNDELLRAAEVAALVYSFNVETAGSEIAEWPLLAALAEQTPRTFRRHIEELRRRDPVQRRGRWRAVMPPALAHHLAKAALENLPAEDLEFFLGNAPPRLLKSFARQLGHLHDRERARLIVLSWLAPGGLLDDYAILCDDRKAIFRLIAPVEPETTLTAIERSLDNMLLTSKAFFDDPLRELAGLLRWLAYDPERFACAVGQLVRVLLARDDDSSIIEKFSELFWLTLSGTRADLGERLAVIDQLIRSENERWRHFGMLALEAMLKVANFSTMNLRTIGARARDTGWRPTTRNELIEWYTTVLARVEGLVRAGGTLAVAARAVLARRFADLWRRELVNDDLERMMKVAGDSQFWPEGYIAVSEAGVRAQRLDESSAYLRLEKQREGMQPRGLVGRVRVLVLPERYGPIEWTEADANGEPMDAYRAADRRAFELGEALADDSAAFTALLPELVRSLSQRVWSLGKGMARAAKNPKVIWRTMVTALAEVEPECRRLHLPIGYLVELQEHEPLLVGCMLDEAIADATMARHFAQLQATVPVDKAGVQRLRLSLNLGLAPIASFEQLAYGRTMDTIDAADLVGLIEAIAQRPDGYFIAVHILSMRLFSDMRRERPSIDTQLIACARQLLLALPVDFGPDINDERTTDSEYLAKVCLKGDEAVEHAGALCRRLLEVGGEAFQQWSRYEQLVLAIFETQPRAALDEFVDPHLLEDNGPLGFGLEDVVGQAIDKVGEADLLDWLEINPKARFLRSAGIVTLLRTERGGDEGPLLSPAAITLIRHAPNRAAVLEVLEVFPSSYGYSGSAATFFERCRTLVREMEDPKDAALNDWLRRVDQGLERAVEHRRTTVRESEERFED